MGAAWSTFHQRRGPVVSIGEQLLLPLGWGPAMADGSLSAAVAAVTGAWIADGVLATQTLDKFGLLARRFARFAAAHDVTTLAGVDQVLVAKFVAAKGRTRHGTVSEAAVATMHNRRAALRAFYRTARRLRLTQRRQRSVARASQRAEPRPRVHSIASPQPPEGARS